MKKYLYLLFCICLGYVGQIKAANTDISTKENVIYISPLSAAAGTQINLSVCMKNSVAIRGFQFDLYLPEGVTVVTSGNGRIKGGLSNGRLPEDDQHTLTLGVQDDGAIRFLCGSQYDETFTGSDGEIATLSVNIAANMAVGEYPILLKAMKLTETDISKFYETALVETTLTVTGPTDTRTILDENSTTVPSAASNVDIRVKRTINVGSWSSICLPFAMTEAQTKEVFGNDVQLAEFTGTDPEFDGDNVVGIKVNFNSVNSITANTPYIIKVSSAVSEFTLDGVNITPDEDEAYIEFDNGKTGSRRVVYSGFYGTYHAETPLDEYTLFLSGGKFWYSAGLTKMKAFRAYFDFLDVLSEVDNAGVKMFVNIDDEETGVENLDANENLNNTIFDLSGRCVNNAQKGVYIVNGKKVLY